MIATTEQHRIRQFPVNISEQFSVEE